MEIFTLILSLIDTAAILYAFGTYIYGRVSYKTICLSVGSFRIRRKDFNVQAVTNIVSKCFYDGGHIPDNVRAEIINITAPKVKDIMYVEEQNLNE